MKSCDEELIYLYDELPASRKREVDHHVANCANCQSIRDHWNRSHALIEQLAATSAEPLHAAALTNKVMEHAREDAAKVRARQLMEQPVYLRYVLALLSILLLLGWGIELMAPTASQKLAGSGETVLRMPRLQKKKQRVGNASLYACLHSTDCKVLYSKRSKQKGNAN